MTNFPTVNDRKALGGLIAHLKQNSKSLKYQEYLTEMFEDWKLLDDDLTPSEYYTTLFKFPSPTKRDIIKIILNGWNIHHDFRTLYENIISLIYLKICDTATYFFMQGLFNCMEKFKSVCPSNEHIYLQCNIGYS